MKGISKRFFNREKKMFFKEISYPGDNRIVLSKLGFRGILLLKLDEEFAESNNKEFDKYQVILREDNEIYSIMIQELVTIWNGKFFKIVRKTIFFAEALPMFLDPDTSDILITKLVDMGFEFSSLSMQDWIT